MINLPARLAKHSDLSSLASLFAASDVSSLVSPWERAEQIWVETLASPSVHVFVADDEGGIAATCTLITAPNLLRSGRRHAFLENVVTHPDSRGMGYGKAVVRSSTHGNWTANTS